MKVIVIGGDAAGMSAAAKLKRLRPDCELVVYEKGNYLSYAACGLPYYVSNPDITLESMIRRTKPEFEAAGIRPLLRHEVVGVLPEDQKVLVRDLDAGAEFEDTYDKLVIASGAHAMIPEVPGAYLPGVQTLKTLDDAAALRGQIAASGIRDVVILGGGYIGVEAAESLAEAGLNIRMLQRSEIFLKNFDPELAADAVKELRRLGVALNTSERLIALEGDGRVERVVTDKGTYPAQAVLLAIGVTPSTEFLQNSGVKLAKNGAVIVDRQMRTNYPDIYAAGDCAEVYHLVSERNAYLPLATTANKCGRIVGENLAGGGISFVGTLGSAAVKVGRLELGRTGLSEPEARNLGFEAASVLVETMNQPHYYPGASPIRLKVIYEKGTGRILGAQGAGRQGVVLRIDVFAAAIASRMSADELGMLDLCYAPPFSNPWDAVHIAANAVK